MRQQGFVKTVLFGLGAGVIAGILVLGPGLRLAMRVVAVQDPFRATEFTIGGTMFIIIFFGLFVGGFLGIPGAIAARYLHRFAAMAIMTFLGMFIIMRDTEIVEELLELGGGPWVNFPMFTLGFLAYSVGFLWLFQRLTRGVGSDGKIRGESIVPTTVGGSL
jgi:hypothetical protein